MNEQDGQLICAGHQRPVTLDNRVFIRHEDGGYCDSTQFEAVPALTREQAMGLLIYARGMVMLRSG